MNFSARLHEAGLKAKPTRISPVGSHPRRRRSIPSLPGFEAGQFYVEDEAAQLIPPLLDARPGDLVLDACAAPGGKATHLAELMQDMGLIYAVDRKHARLKLLDAIADGLGHASVVPIVGDIRQRSAWRKAIMDGVERRDGLVLFDRILVDAAVQRSRRLASASGSQVAEEQRSSSNVIMSCKFRSLSRRLRACGPAGCWSIVRVRQSRKKTKASSINSCGPMRSSGANRWRLGSPRRDTNFLTERGDLSTMGNGIRWTDFTLPV